MELKEYFDLGLDVAAYVALLDEAQAKLHRLYERRAAISASHVQSVRAAGPRHALVITEPWCGDSLAIFPVIVRLLSEAGCAIRVIRRDEHPELIDRYLTDGGRAIPIVVVMDAAFKERFHWGPRPKPAQEIALQFKQDVAAGRMDKAGVHKRIRQFYAGDAGRTVVAEIVEQLSA